MTYKTIRDRLAVAVRITRFGSPGVVFGKDSKCRGAHFLGIRVDLRDNCDIRGCRFDDCDINYKT